MASLSTNMLTRGMNQDVLPRFQPEGSYRYALNSTLMSRQGNKPAIVNELGNELCSILPYNLIGGVLLGSDEYVVFTTNDIDCEIGLLNKVSKTYETLVNSTCLNFNSAKPIDAQWRLVKGCNRIIYFTDAFNNYRVINIDDLGFYKTEAGLWDCSKMELARTVDSPIIRVSSIEDFGGDLKIGSYQFAVRYLDKYLNPTPWLFLTRSVNIVDEDLSDNYYTIDGGFNIINSEDEQGAVQPSTKVINLDLDSLDTSFDYFQIAVVAATAGNATVSNVYILPEQDIRGQSALYTISSLAPSTGAILTDTNEIIISNTVPEIVGTHTQLDNHLYLGNLSFKTYDWASFQRAASNIEVKVVSKQVQVNQDISQVGNAKNPKTPFENKSLAADEVYAIGIQYQIKGYKWSPTFHIPGREKNSTDSQLIAFDANNLDLKPLPQKDTYERWEVYNTASSSTLNTSYFETNADYPDSVDCNGNRIFPTGKIRHHKTPSRRDIALYSIDGQNVLANLLGLEFTIDSYPHPDVTGHRFLISKRDASNSTVLDMGVIVGAKTEGALSGTDPYTQQVVTGAQFENLEQDIRPTSQASPNSKNAFKVLFFLSPKTLTNKISLNNTYFSIIGRLNLSSSEEDKFTGPSINGGGSLEYRTRMNRYLKNLLPTNQRTINYSNPAYFGNRVIQRSNLNIPVTVYNRSYSNTYSVHYMQQNFTDQAGKYVVTIKRYLTPYSNLAAIDYQPLHSNPLNLEDSQIVYGGDVYISEFRVLDLANVDQATGNRTIHYGSKMDGLWVESQLNYELRHQGDSSCNRIYEEGLPVGNYWLIKTTTPTENSGKYDLRQTYCPEYYGYNKDFTDQVLSIPALPLPLTFDYCQDCGEIYPRRIIRSSKSIEEFVSDAYRIFPANDYIDLPGKDKSLTILVTDKDQLYALTENAPYFIPTRPQMLQTSEDSVYLTSGSTAFSIPPRKLVSVDYPYAGCSDKFSVISTQFGTFYVDRKSSKVFHLSDSIQDISAQGMTSFFEENANLSLNGRFIKVTNKPYPINYTTNINGIGYIASFDSRLERLIITKKDYDFVNPDLFGGFISSQQDLQVNPGKIFFDSNLGSFVTMQPGEDIELLSLDNKEVFINKGWTISYSLKDRAWASFHSYLPSMYLNDESDFYSTNLDGQLWVHNTFNYQTYYGQKYDHIIDLISPSQDILSEYWAIQYSSYSEYNGADTDLDTDVFTKAVFYNTQQSSGFKDLFPSKGFAAVGSGNTINTSKVDKYWRVAGIRDYVSNYDVPLFSDQWVDIRDTFPIDKVSNPEAFDIKSAFELARFRDKFLGVRLYAKPLRNVKITTDTVLVAQKRSYR